MAVIHAAYRGVHGARLVAGKISAAENYIRRIRCRAVASLGRQIFSARPIPMSLYR